MGRHFRVPLEQVFVIPRYDDDRFLECHWTEADVPADAPQKQGEAARVQCGYKSCGVETENLQDIQVLRPVVHSIEMAFKQLLSFVTLGLSLNVANGARLTAYLLRRSPADTKSSCLD